MLKMKQYFTRDNMNENLKKINKFRKNYKHHLKIFIKQTKVFSKRYLRTNILFFSFLATSLLNATLLRYLTVKNYFDLKPLFADLAVITMIGAFGYFIKPKHQFKYFFAWSVIFTTLFIINSMYYTNYLSFASISLLSTSTQIVDVGDAVLENVLELKDFSYLWQIVAILFVHRSLKSRKYYEKASKIERGKVRAINTLIVGIIMIGLFISSLNAVDISRLNKQWNREFVVLKFGILSYQFNDLYSSFKSKVTPLFGYDKNAKLFREFFDNREVDTSKNAYTNIFKGKNVIIIHAESIQQFTLDASFNGIPVAPNLKKLASEGLSFTNFYSQESVGTSSDSEFTLNTSLMPTSNGTVFINYFDREYVTIQKLLKEQGYYSFSMHGNNGTFWNRNVVHKSFGYDRFFSYPDDFVLDEEIGLGLSDISFFNQAIPKIKEISQNNARFVGTFLMLTNHTPFSDITTHSNYEVNFKYNEINELTGKMEEVVSPYMEGTKLGNYFKSVNYADAAIGMFLDNLDKEGLLDNTVVVIYGDHDAKLKKSEFIRYYNYDPYTNTMLTPDNPNYKDVDYYSYELNRKVPFIIWSKKKKLSKTVNKVMGMYDVLPTLGNMFGFSSPYALGHDIFKIDENVVVFPDSNWLTDKVYYNSQKEEVMIINPGDTISVDYINKYNKIADDYISVSDAIIVYDLIRKNNEKQDFLKSIE